MAGYVHTPGETGEKLAEPGKTGKPVIWWGMRRDMGCLVGAAGMGSGDPTAGWTVGGYAGEEKPEHSRIIYPVP